MNPAPQSGSTELAECPTARQAANGRETGELFASIGLNGSAAFEG